MSKPTKILFDAGPLVNGQKSGVGQYTYRLIDALAAAYPQDMKFVGHYFNFLGRKNPQLPTRPNISYRSSRVIPGKVLSILRRFGLQLPFDLLIKTRGDVVLFPNFVRLPVLQSAGVITVVHDLGFSDYPQYLQGPNQKFLQRFVPQSIKKSGAIITLSEDSRGKIISRYAVAPERVTVIEPAVDHRVFSPRPAAQIQSVRRKYNLPENYILYTGTLEPRKNIKGLISAYSALGEDLVNSYALVLAGGRGWQTEELDTAIKAANGRVISTGYVPDEDLPAMYSGAALFVFPSFYEGFGMPPLEAMACGVPVITSNNSSLPEVVGDAALLVEAEDTPAITSAIKKVLNDKGLAAAMRQKGLARAQKFSWAKSANDLLEVFKKIIG